MKKSRLYLLLALVSAAAFVFGLSFDKLFTKTYANAHETDVILPSASAFESLSSGMTSSANYEIVTIYGRKYIIFSSGGDIEVLNY
ncbi:MAG: hypothetical protein IJL44_00385 [Bacteroidales bacterium]|nr:hypothetical protein [Bacteroidales bacterium]